jgi:hypothetical protein
LSDPGHIKYKITSFDQIGWIDPFPEEDQSSTTEVIAPETLDDLVYDTARYYPNASPFVIYFPIKILLFKLMRASIGVTKEKDLWFNIKK